MVAIPAAALLAVLSLQIYGWLDQQDKTPEPTPLAATIQPEKRALPASVREPEPQPAAEPEVQEAKSEAASPASPPESAPVERVAATPLTATEPQEAAPAPEAVPEPVIPEPTPVAPPAVVGKEELVMPADAVRLGTVNFLNGNWRVSVDARTPITVTGRPPSLRYQIKTARVRQE